MEMKRLKLEKLIFFKNRNKPTHYYCLTLLGNIWKFLSPNNQSQRICFIYIFCPISLTQKAARRQAEAIFSWWKNLLTGFDRMETRREEIFKSWDLKWFQMLKFWRMKLQKVSVYQNFYKMFPIRKWASSLLVKSHLNVSQLACTDENQWTSLN